MKADEVLTRTFAEHDHPTPDPEAVLAAVHAGLARRRRTMPLVAAAATAAAVAIGASVLVGVQRQSGPPPAAPSTPTPTAVIQSPGQPAPTPVDPLSRLPLPVAANATVGIDTRWLPPGTAKQTDLSVFYGRQTREYEVDGGGSTTDVELRLWTGSSLTPDQFLDAKPRDLTVGGRAAREWAGTDLYVIVLRVPGGQVAQVNVFWLGGAKPGTDALAATGRRIAESLRLDRAEPVRPQYRPTYAPKGLVVRWVGVRDLDGTNWALSKPDADTADPGVVLALDKRTGANPTVGGSAVPGRPVRGHATHVNTDGDRVSLWVDGLVHGQTLVVIDDRGLVPVSELYKIADGVR
jgi:hypothetical protein